MIAAMLFTGFCIMLFGPTPMMLGFLLLSCGIAIAFGLTNARYMFRRKAVSVARVTIASAILFCAVIVCMATAEEAFIYFFTKGWAEDAVGRSRHIYPQVGWNADGYRGLPSNLWKMALSGAFVGWIWGGVLSLVRRLGSR